ncbi:MAG: hypothetical protein HY860_04900 [Chlamydiales bacterium]|nr:hypothetical protein [Chlamydiales bacterium]
MEIIKDDDSLDCFLTRKNGYFSPILRDNRLFFMYLQQEDKKLSIKGMKLIGRQKIKLDKEDLEQALHQLSKDKKTELIVENLKTTIEIEDFLKQYNKLKTQKKRF